MKKIGTYEIIGESTATSSAVYWKAKKNGEYFFLKKFNGPVRPSDLVTDSKILQKINNSCDRFEKERKSINETIKKLGGGNFVAPVDFFLHDRYYYQATPLRNITKKTINEIVQLSDKEKLLILKTAANCVMTLHSVGIVHCDIKWDNLPVTVTQANRFTCSLIDFDSAHFENDIPHPDEISVTDAFMSPELASYKTKQGYYGDYKFGVKNDVFALAIVFHYYWSGERTLLFESTIKRPYLHHAVFEGVAVSVSPKVPEWLKIILLKMIDRDPEKRPCMSEVLEYLKSVDVENLSNSNINFLEITDNDTETQPTEQVGNQDERYIKNDNFPDDAISFKVMPNGNIIITYDDGSKIALNINVAIKRKYIKEK